MNMFSRSARLVQSSSRPLVRRAADKQGMQIDQGTHTERADNAIIDANVKMRTGPNYAPICAAILGVGGIYWFWSKKEADKGGFYFWYLTTTLIMVYDTMKASEKVLEKDSLKTNRVTENPGGGGSKI